MLDAPRRIFYGQRNEILHLDVTQYQDKCNSVITGAVDQLIQAYVTRRPDGLLVDESLDRKICAWGLSGAWHEKIRNSLRPGADSLSEYAEALRDWLRFDINARLTQITRNDEDAIRVSMLMALDHQWREFSDHVELVRSGIHLRAYAQQKPDLIFKAETFELFKRYQADLPVVSLDFIYGAIVAFEQDEQARSEGEPVEDEA